MDWVGLSRRMNLRTTADVVWASNIADIRRGVNAAQGWSKAGVICQGKTSFKPDQTPGLVYPAPYWRNYRRKVRHPLHLYSLKFERMPE